MPVFKNRTASEVAKKVRTFFSRGAGFGSRVASGKQALRRVAGKDGELDPTREVARVPRSPRESTPVFFIVGHQKSGTTWLMKMLDSHPEILCQGEGRPFGREWRQEQLKKRRASYPPTSLYNAIASSEDLRYWVERSVWSKRDDADQHLANLTRLAVEYFLTQQLLKSGKKLVGDKTVLHEAEIVEEIGTIFSEAKVIHIVRDGRDVAVSQTHHKWNQAEDQGGGGKINPDQLAKREAYRQDPRALLEKGEGIFPEGWLTNHAAKWSDKVSKAAKDGPALLGANYAEVRYEDLLERPEEEIGRLLEFLGADASERVVRQCVDAASFEKLSEGRKRGQEAASFFRKGIAGDWKNTFTEKDKRDFKVAAGDLLVELGYEENHDW